MTDLIKAEVELMYLISSDQLPESILINLSCDTVKDTLYIDDDFNFRFVK